MSSPSPLSPRWVSRRNAFSLTEIVVVIAILATLAVLLASSYQRVLAGSRAAACTSNLRQIGMAMSAYAAENGGLLPCVKIASKEQGTGDLYWSKALGPYLPLKGKGATSQENQVFVCPAAAYPGENHSELTRTYLATSALYGFNTAASWETGTMDLPRRMVSIEHPADTVLVAEGKQESAGAHACDSGAKWSWVQPDLAAKDPKAMTQLDFRHAGRMNLLYADGHVGTVDTTAAKKLTRREWEGRNVD